MTDYPRLPRPRVVVAALASVAMLALLAAVVAVRLLPGGTEVGLDTVDEQLAATDGARSAPLVVFAEFGAAADDVYVAPADAPDQRTPVGTIEHAAWWGINPAPAMAGTRFAYTVLPPASPGQAGSPAELWIMDIESGERTRLARDADLLVAPQFTDDGQQIVYRRSSGSEQEIVRLDLATSTRHVVHAERTTFGIFPIGYGADGALVYARLSTAGTDIMSVREGHAPTLLFHASDHIARDWEIAPDGRSIAYLAVEEAVESILHRARAWNLASGEPLPLSRAEGLEGEQYAPTWTEDGDGIAVGRQAQPDEPGGVVVETLDGELVTLPPPERGFDVPIAWSPGGRYLAVRTFTGINSVDPGEESIVILDRAGERYPIAAEAEVIFIGWIARG